MLSSLEKQVNFIQIGSHNFNSYENNSQQERRPSLVDVLSICAENRQTIPTD